MVRASETKSLIRVVIPDDISTDRAAFSTGNIHILCIAFRTAAAILAGIVTDLADTAAALGSGDLHPAFRPWTA